MFRFSATSLERLGTCDPQLQKLMHAVMAKQLMDFTIVEGYRGQAKQNAAYQAGTSRVTWPNSKHNRTPSGAIDIAPYPIRWGRKGEPDRVKAIGRFYYLAGIVLATAEGLALPLRWDGTPLRWGNVSLRWGGDWNQDGDIMDNKFDDLLHYELVE